MCSFSANSSIRHCLLEKLNYTPDCTVASMNFQNFLGRSSPSPLPRSFPHSIPGFAFDSGFDLKSRALRALGLGFTLNSPPICLINSPNKGNKIKYFTPLPQLLGYATVFYNSIYRLSYIAGRPERPGRPGPPPQYFRQVGAYDMKSHSAFYLLRFL